MHVSCMLSSKPSAHTSSFESGLAKEAIDHGRLLWKIRPKFHKCPSDVNNSRAVMQISAHHFCWFTVFLRTCRLDHICYDQAERINPLVLSCYMDEDAAANLQS